MSINDHVSTYAQILRGFDREKGESDRHHYPNVPRNAFTFFVEFGFNEAATNELNAQFQETIKVMKEGNSAYVKAFTKPSYTFETEKIRSYNQNYILKKKIEFNDVTMTLFDDSRSVSRNLVEAFRFAHSVTGNPFKSSRDFAGEDISRSTLLPTTGDNKEFGLKMKRDSDRNLFDYIRIYDLGTDRRNVQIYTLYKPMIKSIDATQLDYSDGDGLQEINVEIEYIYYDYSGNNNSIDLDTGFGFFKKHIHGDLEPNPRFFADEELGIEEPEFLRGLRDTLESNGIDPGRLIQSVQNSIQGGRLNLNDLRRNLFETLAEGTPIQNIRNVVRNVRLIEQAFEQGRFLDIVPLLGENIGQLGPLSNADTFGLGEIRDGITNTIRSEVSDNIKWITRHANPKRTG